MNLDLKKTIVVTGHYGSGKTNLSLNLAMMYRRQGREVALADLDIVNPYFRTSDFREFAVRHNIRMIASEYAGSTLDIPALTGQLDAQIGRGDAVLIIDVGGDDVGAHAAGRYSPRLKESGYSMLYVINYYRYLTRDPAECVQLLREIEQASRLQATHIANCSNLGQGTTPEEIIASLPYAQIIMQETGLPLAFTAAHSDVAGELADMADVLPVEIYVHAPWA